MPKYWQKIVNGWRLRALFRIEKLIREIGDHVRAKRMGMCGNTIRVTVSREYRSKMLFRPQLRCKDRVCPVCNSYRASILARKVERLGMRMSNPHMLTVTASPLNRNDLRVCMEKYKSSIRAFKRNTTWFKKYVAGGIEHVEVVRQRDRGWHIHSHMLVDMKTDRMVGNLYSTATGMELDPVKRSMEEALRKAGLGTISDIRPVIEGYGSEISKYALKLGTDISDEDLKEFIVTLKGKRMISRFGNCYGIKDLEELEEEEHEEYDDLGTIDDVVNKCFADEIDADLVQYVTEAVRIGLIELESGA